MNTRLAPTRFWLHLPMLVSGLALFGNAHAQSIAVPWRGHGHDAQHSGISEIASQPLSRILWQTPVDLDPQYSGTNLLIHYGAPLITRLNTVLIAVKTGATDGFRVEARNPADGSLKWMQDSDYTLPAHNWTPSYGITLSPKNRLFFAGPGGTVYFRDEPDMVTGTTGQLAFYGLSNYAADMDTFNTSVKISTPLTSDRYGNIFFGFEVSGATSPALQSGIARIAEDGSGTWIGASAAAADTGINKVVMNCAPALSNDHKTLYIAVSAGNFQAGYLVALDSRTLAPMAKVRLKDVLSPAVDALLPDNGTSSPTVGPDGDVYFGVLEGVIGTNHFRGWLEHFDSTLALTKIAGAFGWDDTASIVAASLVPSYHGTSQYLLLSKYNNYVGAGGDGVNKLAILDPNDSMIDPISGATVMKEILIVVGPTPDDEYSIPGAVREWCVNIVAIDPFTKSAVVHSEDGKVYRWKFETNTLTEALTVTNGLGAAYTPTTIGVDGTVYIIANASLFAIGN